MNGMKAVNNFTVSTSWKNGKATRITIVNHAGQTMPVLYKNLADAKVYVDDEFVKLDVDQNGVATLSGKEGTTYVFDFDDSYMTGIGQATATAFHFSIDGRKVSAEGCDVKQMRVYDLNGRLVQQSQHSSVHVNRSAGHAFVVEATDAEGHTRSQKVVLN